MGTRIPSLGVDSTCRVVAEEALGKLLALAGSTKSPRELSSWSSAARGQLGSLLAGRQWPQARLHAYGWASNPWCQLCLQVHGREVEGTLAHRLWCCPVLDPVRANVFPEDVLRAAKAAQAAGEGHLPLWSRGLGTIDIAAIPVHPPASFSWITAPPDEVLLPALIYTDGSGMDRDLVAGEIMARYAWSLVVVRADGVFVAEAAGSTPPWTSSVYFAEVWAILQAVSLPIPGDLTVITDCLSAVQAFEAGVMEHGSATDSCAGLWRSAAAALGDRRLSLIWMPAHCHPDDAGQFRRSDDQLLSVLDIQANARADILARDAAASTCVDGALKEAILQQQEFTAAVARGLALVCAAAQDFPVDAGTRIRDVAPLPRPVNRGAAASLPAAESPRRVLRNHSVFIDDGGLLRCARCGRCSVGPDRRFLRQPCRGMPVPLPATDADLGHQTQSSGTVRWCRLCGAYAEVRLGALAVPCPGHPPNAGRRERLRLLNSGRHPRFKVSL